MPHTHLKASFFRRASSVVLATLMFVNAPLAHSDGTGGGYTVPQDLQTALDDAKLAGGLANIDADLDLAAAKEAFDAAKTATDYVDSLSDTDDFDAWWSAFDKSKAADAAAAAAGATAAESDTAAFDASQAVLKAANAIAAAATSRANTDFDNAAKQNTVDPNSTAPDMVDLVAAFTKAETAKDKAATDASNASTGAGAATTAEAKANASAKIAIDVGNENSSDSRLPGLAATAFADAAAARTKETPAQTAAQAAIDSAVAYANAANDYYEQSLVPIICPDDSVSCSSTPDKAAEEDKAAEDKAAADKAAADKAAADKAAADKDAADISQKAAAADKATADSSSSNDQVCPTNDNVALALAALDGYYTPKCVDTSRVSSGKATATLLIAGHYVDVPIWSEPDSLGIGKTTPFKFSNGETVNVTKAESILLDKLFNNYGNIPVDPKGMGYSDDTNKNKLAMAKCIIGCGQGTTLGYFPRTAGSMQSCVQASECPP